MFQEKFFLTIISFLVFSMPVLGKMDQTQHEKAALEKQVKQLSGRISDLESKGRIVGELTKKELVTTSNPLSLRIKGHVNRAVIWHSNGKQANVVHADIDNSPTRLNFTALGKISDQRQVGATIEVALEPNSTDEIDVHDANDNSSAFNIRKVEVFIKDKTWGELFVGQGSTASDSTMEDPDQSATTVISLGSSVSFIASGVQFFDSGTNAKALVDGQRMLVGTVFDASDGLFRRNRIRYNTPQYYGFSLQTSHYYKRNNDNWDVVLKYAGTTLGTKIAAQLAYLKRLSKTVTVTAGTTPAKYTQLNGSAGVLFPTGISIFVSANHRDWKVARVNDGSIYFAKLGYQRKFIEAGKTAFSIDYGQYTGLIFDTRAGREKDKYRGTSYGAIVVQFLGRVGTELFLGARIYTLKGPSSQQTSYKDVKIVLSGMRVKF